jgi:hypothetical protein
MQASKGAGSLYVRSQIIQKGSCMSDRFSSYQAALEKGVLTSEGEVTPALRQSVASLAASFSGVENPVTAQQLPEELVAYVTTVALYAYRVNDEDFETLRQVGYSDDALFEITISAALGAGIGRFEQGLKALKGATHATQNA